MPRPLAVLVAGFLAACPALALAAERLASERSAFLQANASSPIDWAPWGPEAFARAKALNKPVFVCVGSFTSELARSMRIQTFAAPEVATWMNQAFVCILVDRDEHPDVDAMYRDYLSRVKQLGGSPLNIWLTPELLPYEGSGYLSQVEEWGRPSFIKLAREAGEAWTSDPAGCRKRGAEALAHVGQEPAPPAWDPAKASTALAVAAQSWVAVSDPDAGGFGEPPRNPEPELLRFLLTRGGSDHDAAVRTLRALAQSGVRDPLDGGFFHAATDASWKIPYRQKILSDQARIALAYLDGAEGADAASFSAVARGVLDFALRHFGKLGGTFAAADDASAEEFAAAYAWTKKDVDQLLGPAAAAFESAHAITAEGNIPAADDPSGTFAGRNLPRSSAMEDLPLQASAARLLAIRDARAPVPRDLRASVGVHGLMIAALARAGSQLGEPRYTRAARSAFAVLKANYVEPGGNLRRFAGSDVPASPEDYAAAALGCAELAADDTESAAAAAFRTRLLAELDARFLDAASGRYFAVPAQLPAGFFFRPPADPETPSAGALALLASESPEHARSIAAALLDGLGEPPSKPAGDSLLALGSLSPGG